MKVCGKCGHSNDDDSIFCVIDGAALDAGVGQSSTRIFVDLDNQQTSPENETQVVTAVPTAEVSPPPRSPASLYAALGALGAIVVLLGRYIILNSGSNRESDTESPSQAAVQSANPPQDTFGAVDNASVGERESTSMPGPMNANETQKNKGALKIDGIAKERLLRKRFNGRVIMMNAIVRSSPSIYAPEVYVISYDEPIKIGKSAGGNIPWFRVTTTRGVTGWMHGNTIEFVR